MNQSNSNDAPKLELDEKKEWHAPELTIFDAEDAQSGGGGAIDGSGTPS